MNILITNDDGYNSKGIIELVNILRNIKEVKKIYVIAPNVEMSATSHRISVFFPIFLEKIKEYDNVIVYATNGSPADCVKIGVLSSFLKEKIDIVLSGINIGANITFDTYYSGTISAAREALFHSIPSLAISINTYEKECDFGPSRPYLEKILKRFIFSKKNKQNLKLFNINIPYKNKIKGIKFTELDQTNFQVMMNYVKIKETIKDPIFKNKFYFWLAELRKTPKTRLSDFYAIQNGYISITPLKIQITDYKFLHKKRKKNEI